MFWAAHFDKGKIDPDDSNADMMDELDDLQPRRTGLSFIITVSTAQLTCCRKVFLSFANLAASAFEG